MALAGLDRSLLKRATDLAELMGVSLKHVVNIALARGLIFLEAEFSPAVASRPEIKREPWKKPSAVATPDNQAKEERQKQESEAQEKIDRFIAENYQNMTDGELSRHLGIGRQNVASRRHRLGYKRAVKTEAIRSKIDQGELRTAVTEGGLTVPDFIHQKGLQVSRERMRQLCDEWGIPTARSGRSALWYANRMGKPELGQKDWLETQLREERGAPAVAAKIGVRPDVIQNQARRLGIDPNLLVAKAEFVDLICTNCGKAFSRSKYLLRNPNQKVFFHNKVCHGQWLTKQNALWRRKKGSHRKK